MVSGLNLSCEHINLGGIKELREENENLLEDATFLKKQLQECKTNNKKLKIALSKSHNQYEKLIVEARKQGKVIPDELVDREHINLGIGLNLNETAETYEQHTEEQFTNEYIQKPFTERNDDTVEGELEKGSDTGSKKLTVNTFPLKTEDVTKIDYFLTELFQSGKSKEQIKVELKRFLEDTHMRRERVLELYKNSLKKKLKQKEAFEFAQNRMIYIFNQYSICK